MIQTLYSTQYNPTKPSVSLLHSVFLSNLHLHSLSQLHSLQSLVFALTTLALQTSFVSFSLSLSTFYRRNGSINIVVEKERVVEGDWEKCWQFATRWRDTYECSRWSATRTNLRQQKYLQKAAIIAWCRPNDVHQQQKKMAPAGDSSIQAIKAKADQDISIPTKTEMLQRPRNMWQQQTHRTISCPAYEQALTCQWRRKSQLELHHWNKSKPCSCSRGQSITTTARQESAVRLCISQHW